VTPLDAVVDPESPADMVIEDGDPESAFLVSDTGTLS
jgi:hypothetical protein